jgi:hypothetical protein
MNTQPRHSTVRQMLDKTRAPKRRRRSARSRADQEGWRQLLSRLPRLPTIAENPYAASNVLMGTDRRYLDTLFPTVHTDIAPDVDLHAHVQARWPSVTAKEREMIEHMMSLYPDISDRSLRIDLGLRRGSVPRDEW